VIVLLSTMMARMYMVSWEVWDPQVSMLYSVVDIFLLSAVLRFIVNIPNRWFELLVYRSKI
jgi:hypothetical protein